MSLLFADGFEGLSATVDAYLTNGSTTLARKYLSSFYGGNCYLRAGRTGGYSIEPAYGYGSSITTYPLSTASDTYVVGIGIRPSSSFVPGNIPIVCFQKTASYTALTFNYNYPTKEIIVLNRSSVEIGRTARANLDRGTWNYVEIKVKDAVDGYVIIRVNGYEMLYLNHVDTTSSQGVGINTFYFTFGNGSNYGIRIDDLYILNAAGSVNNDFLGNVQIRGILPTSDTATKDWGRSAGTDNFALVDEVTMNDDTDYTTADSTASDLFGYSDVSDLGTIAGIQVNTIIKEMTTAVIPTIKNLVNSASTIYEQGTNQAITTSYKTLYSIVETDPATTDPWVVTDLNAVEFGVKRV